MRMSLGHEFTRVCLGGSGGGVVGGGGIGGRRLLSPILLYRLLFLSFERSLDHVVALDADGKAGGSGGGTFGGGGIAGRLDPSRTVQVVFEDFWTHSSTFFHSLSVLSYIRGIKFPNIKITIDDAHSICLGERVDT
jgi:hypothetical protein